MGGAINLNHQRLTKHQRPPMRGAPGMAALEQLGHHAERDAHVVVARVGTSMAPVTWGHDVILGADVLAQRGVGTEPFLAGLALWSVEAAHA